MNNNFGLKTKGKFFPRQHGSRFWLSPFEARFASSQNSLPCQEGRKKVGDKSLLSCKARPCREMEIVSI